MMKLTRDQIIRLVLFGSAVVAMLLLISGISQIQLQPGLPFSSIWAFLIGDFTSVPRAPGGGDLSSAGGFIVDLVRTLFFIGLAVFPIAIVLVMLDPEERKRALRALLQIAVLLALFSLFVQNQSLGDLEGEDRFGSETPGEEGLGGVDPLTEEEFDPASIPSWLIWTASLGIGLLIAVSLIVVINQIRKSREDEELPLVEIARRAQTAIDEIGRGNDLRGTILRCYAEMTRIVREERGVRRDSAVTAREFTDFLIRANLPDTPVVRLTRLFEKARYSSGTPTSQDEQEAVASLQAIVDACLQARSSA
jgi:hypothetical protein